VSIPLLRGAGRHIVEEPLTQAERDVLYAILEFEQFKRDFAVGVATQYLEVLQQLDEVDNAEAGYRRLLLAAARSRRLAAAGRLPEIQVDQAIQEELSARDRWIGAMQSYANELDQFKSLLGLPPDAEIMLDREELARLARAAAAALEPTTQSTQPTTAATMPRSTTMPTLEEIELDPPSSEGAGPYEMPEPTAIRLALDRRPDLRVAQGEVTDAQRRVVVAADGLRADLDVIGRASFGDRRGIGSADESNAQLRPENGTYDLSAPLELPLERTAARNRYREAWIQLEVAVRQLQQLEDEVKRDVRGALRDLLSSRESVVTQSKAVAVAQRRVDSTDMLLQAGRAEIRDVLEAQTDLVDAQNEYTTSLVEYRVAELELQRDTGVLEVDHQGIWREFLEDTTGARTGAQL
jgi:outer membrane protein TolC